MSHCAEFQIIGRIGQIKKVGTTLRVTIASGYPYKDDRGDWQERTRWNEITVFNDARQSYVQRNLKPGDLIRATGPRDELEERRPTTASPSPASRSAASPRAPTTPPAPTTAPSDERAGSRKPPRPTSWPAGRLAPRHEPLAPRPSHHRPLEAYIVDFRKLKGLTPGGAVAHSVEVMSLRGAMAIRSGGSEFADLH